MPADLVEHVQDGSHARFRLLELSFVGSTQVAPIVTGRVGQTSEIVVVGSVWRRACRFDLAVAHEISRDVIRDPSSFVPAVRICTPTLLAHRAPHHRLVKVQARGFGGLVRTDGDGVPLRERRCGLWTSQSSAEWFTQNLKRSSSPFTTTSAW